ncbi:MAG TPA: hypothetical protein VEQ59_13600, partial [Polyangiaceae bacterium]|nr:hypothetical protein [Polyangiaceae bacterium]
DLGVWKAVGEGGPGRIREERCLLPDGRHTSRYLLRQVRYRDALSGEIVGVEAEQRLSRRRISSRSRS